MKTIEAVEHELCATYIHEARIYAQALHLAEQVSGQIRAGSDGGELLARIGELLAEVGMLESEAEALRVHWQRERTTPGPELRGHLAHIATLIQGMQDHLGTAMKSADEKKRALAPELDDAGRRQLGCRAYGASRL